MQYNSFLIVMNTYEIVEYAAYCSSQYGIYLVFDCKDKQRITYDKASILIVIQSQIEW